MHMKGRKPTTKQTSPENGPKWFEDAKHTHEHQAKYLDKIISMKESLAREEREHLQQQQQSGGPHGRFRHGVSGGNGCMSGTTPTSASFSYNQSSSNPGFPTRGAKTKSREKGKGRSQPDVYPVDVQVQGKGIFDKGREQQTQREKQARWWRSSSVEEKHLIKRSSKDMPKILPPVGGIPPLDRRSAYSDKLKSYSATGSKIAREESERDKMIDLKMPVKKSAKSSGHAKGTNKSTGKLCKARPSDRPLKRSQSLDFRCELAPVNPPSSTDTDVKREMQKQGRYRSNTFDFAAGRTGVGTIAKHNSLSELMDKMDVLEGAVGGSSDAMEYSDEGCSVTAAALNDEPMPDDVPNSIDADEGGQRANRYRVGIGRSLLEISKPGLLEPSSAEHQELQRRHTLPIINLRPPTPRLSEREEKTVDTQIGRILRKVACQSVIRKRELSRLCEDIEEFNEINTVLADKMER